MIGLLHDHIGWLKKMEEAASGDPLFRDLGVARFFESVLALLVLKLPHIVVQDHQLSNPAEFEKFWVSTMIQFSKAHTIAVSDATWQKKITAAQLAHQSKTKPVLMAEFAKLGPDHHHLEADPKSLSKSDLVRAYAEALIAKERASVDKDRFLLRCHVSVGLR